MADSKSSGPLIWTDPIGPFDSLEEAENARDGILMSKDATRLEFDTMLIWTEGTDKGIMVRVGPKAKELLGDQWGERIFPPKSGSSAGE